MKPVFVEIGLTRDELTALDAYTTRMVAALAHLREFWRVGDDAATEAIEDAIRAIAGSRSFVRNYAVCVKVLGHGLVDDQRAMFFSGCGLGRDAAAAAQACETVPHTIFKCRVKDCPKCAAKEAGSVT